MSLSSFLNLFNRNQDANSLNTTIHQDIDNLVRIQQSNVEIPWQFMSTTQTLTNFGADAVVVESDTVPTGYTGIVRDLNVIFTTAGGTLAFDVKYPSGGSVRFTAGVTANTSGQGNIIIPGGGKFQIVLTSTGSGVIAVTWHGVIQQTVIPNLVFPKVQVDSDRRAGF